MAKFALFIVLSILTVNTLGTELASANAIVVGVPSDVYEDYITLSPHSYDAPPNYAHSNTRRDVVELLILQRALALGGFEEPLVVRPTDGYLRILRQLAEGKITITGTTVWDFDARELVEDVWVSNALVRRGEFVVGLYTREKNEKVLAAQTLPQLLQLTPVTSRNWKMDWSLLEQMGYKHLQYASSWESMVRMVLAGRADFVLAPFPATSSLYIQAEGGRYLQPIPGIKVAFPAERVFAVSKNHFSSLAVYEALQRGIKLMRASGELEQAYRDSGFFNHYTQSWNLVYP